MDWLEEFLMRLTNRILGFNVNFFAGIVAFAALLMSSLPYYCAGAEDVPGIINYQGRVMVNGTNLTGTGRFKFALVNATGTTTFWSNDGTSVNGSEPASTVSL